MLGANSLVGELFSHDFFDLKRQGEYGIIELDFPFQKPEEFNSNKNPDNPWLNFNQGIVSASGGHFEALFQTVDDAERFAREAARRAGTKCPGLMLDFFLSEINLGAQFNPHAKKDETNLFSDTAMTEIRDRLDTYVPGNPFLQMSADGNLPISADAAPCDEKREPSEYQHTLEEQADRFYANRTQDQLSSWRQQVIESLNMGDKFKDFEEFCKLSLTPKRNLLALLKLDGNAVGQGFLDFQNSLQGKNVGEALAEMEHFWYKKRQAMMRMMHLAVKNATNSLFKKYNKHALEQKTPFIMLMMGGDDIMLLCLPEFIHFFLRELKSELEYLNKASFSMGIAFFKYSYPFSHANELAESLLDSAKVKSRETNPPSNALDWHILYSTKPLSIGEIRRKDYLIGYQEGLPDVLSGKPYTLSEGLDLFDKAGDLAYLIAQNKDNESEDAGKNKYKMLRTSIYKGKKHVQGLIRELLDPTSDWLKEDKFSQMLDVIELLDTIPEEEK